MYDAIKELWYGKTQPWEKHITDTDKISELFRKLEELEEAIRVHMGSNEHLFAELSKSHFELLELLCTDAFVKGFKIGGKLIAEIFK